MSTSFARHLKSDRLPGVDKALVHEAQIKATGANIHAVSETIMMYVESDPVKHKQIHEESELKLRYFCATGVAR